MSQQDIFEFERELKSKISIADLYTQLTGNQFVNVQGGLRAKVAWRIDNNPSLHYHPGKNILTDFSDVSNYAGKNGAIYNHLTLLVKLEQATSRRHAIPKLAALVNVPIPEDLVGVINRSGKEQEALNQLWKASQAFAMGMFSSPEQYPIMRAYCADRGIPFEREFWAKMQIGVWPMASVLDQIKEEYELTKKKSKLLINAPTEFESRAIVFPLHNSSGTLVGLTVRCVTSPKKFLKFSVHESGMYGALDAIAQERAMWFEGQFNQVAMGATHYRLFSKRQADGSSEMLESESFLNYTPPMSCTGSRNFDPKDYKDIYTEVVYCPDFDIKLIDGEKKVEVCDSVLKIYNTLQVPQFRATFWPEGYDKFDADDFFVSRIGDEEKALEDFNSYQLTIPEWFKKWIERKTKHISDKVQRDSSIYAYIEIYSRRFYNLADRQTLRELFNFISDKDVDHSVIDDIDYKNRTQITEDIFREGNAYYLESGTEDEPSIHKLSSYIVKPLYKTITISEVSQDIGEFEDRANETHGIRAELRFESGRVTTITFNHTDLVDNRTFTSCISKNCMEARLSMPAGKESINVLQAVMVSLETKEEFLHLHAAGPHLRADTPEHRRTTLRPDWLGDKMGTMSYLNRGCSVVNGTIVNNRNINVEFTSFDCYNFGTYSDAEHARISKLIWEKMHTLHRPWFIKTMLGAVCATPIKHLISPQTNGLCIALFGQSNAHKTSTAAIMNNFFGDISSDSQLMNFNSTPKAFETKAARAGSIFIVCDEFIPHKDFTMEQLGDTVHNMFAGRTKARLHTSAKLQETFPYTGVYVITGEFSDKLRSSTESRFLAYRIEEFEAKPVFNELILPENLQKYKCWTPRLIAWEHINIDMLCRFRAERRALLEKRLGNIPNANRIAEQQAIVETGYYAYIKFSVSENTITEEEGKSSLQDFLLWTEQNVTEQLFRATSSTFHKKFIQYFGELIRTGAINYARITGEGELSKVKFSQDEKRACNLVIYERRGELRYVVPSFDALLREINRAYAGDVPFTNSIKYDLHENKLIELDKKKQFMSTEYPDPRNPQVKLRGRVFVMTDSVLFGDIHADTSEHR